MTFTEDDATNDGKIKKEAGATMAQTAAQGGEELYDAFLEVCSEAGQTPSEVLGDYLVRALNDEGFSERLLQTEIDMMKIKADELRKEDLMFVKEIADEFDLMGNDDTHPVRELVERRLQAKGGGALSQVMGDRSNGDGGGAEVERLEARMNRMEAMIEQIAQDEKQQPAQAEEQSKSRRQSVDELFSGEEDSESDESDDGSASDKSGDVDGPPITTDAGVGGDEE